MNLFGVILVILVGWALHAIRNHLENGLGVIGVIVVLILFGWGASRVKRRLFAGTNLPVATAVALIAVTLIFAWSDRKPSHLAYWKLNPVAAKVNTGTGPCFGKDECIIAYVAPWCPVCEGNLACFKNFNARRVASEQSGFSVFVGWGDRPALENMARNIGDNTFIDSGENLKGALRISQVPTWISLDSHGKVTHRAVGVPVPCTPETVREYLFRK
jgi:hypothetical protein